MPERTKQTMLTKVKVYTLAPPNISTLRTMEARGELVTQQKRPTRPRAAENPGSSPRRPPQTQPKVAPMQKVGTISPPLNPALRVMAVNRSFTRKLYQSA